MKKFIVEELEKKLILKKHGLLREQATGNQDLELLRKAAQYGCLSGGNIVTDNKSGKYVYRKKSVRDTSKIVYLYADMTWKYLDNSEKGKWVCDFAGKEEKKREEEVKKKEEEAGSTTNIQRTKDEGGWKERKDIQDTDANVNNPQIYDKTVVNNVTLYRRKSGAGITGGLDERQKKVIEKYKAQGAKLEKELDAEQAKTWTKTLVSPKSEGLFSEDLYMYFPPEIITDTELTVAFKQAVQSQTPKNRQDCKDSIDAYYWAYKKKKKMEPNQLRSMKEKVQACVNEFQNKWGVLSKVDDYVDELRMTRDANWKLS
jgi:hypothetical protein